MNPSMPSYPPQWARSDSSITRDTGSTPIFWTVVFLLVCSALVLYMLMQLMPGFSHMR